MTAVEVCVVGSFMKDLVARVHRRPLPGETVHGLAFDEYLGGKGVNQAVAAARAGAATAMVGRVGVDRYGDEFLAALAAEGIDTSHVKRDHRQGTGVGLPVVQADGENSIVIVPRANQSVTVTDIARAAPVIASARVLAVQLELPVPASTAALRLARDAGVLTILNPAPYQPFGDAAGLIDVLVPNEREAEQLAGVPCDGDNAPAVACGLAQRWTRHGVVLTLGGRGAVVAFRAAGGWAVEELPAHPVDVVDTVGAGDAFCGALAARLAAGADLVAAARYANAAGALAVTRQGAVPSMPTANQIAAILAASAAPPRITGMPEPVR